MENRKLIYFFGLLFSAIFALLYYGLFHTFLEVKTESLTIYYNQIGLYKNEDNAWKAVEQLKNKNIDGYIFVQEDINAVICGISMNQEETRKTGELLKEEGMDFIEKQWSSNNQAILQAMQENDIETVLEMIRNESQGNEQAGTSA